MDVDLAPSVDNFNGNLEDLYFHVCFCKIEKSCHAFVDDFLNRLYHEEHSLAIVYIMVLASKDLNRS